MGKGNKVAEDTIQQQNDNNLNQSELQQTLETVQNNQSPGESISENNNGVVSDQTTENNGLQQNPETIKTDQSINSGIDDSGEEHKKTTAVPVVTVENTEILQQTKTIVVFRATRPMMKNEYEELSARVRAENQKSGLKIVLAPAIVDGVEIIG